MKYAKIIATGSYLPGDPVTNEDLVKRGIDTSDEWIRTRTGIQQRYFVLEDQQTSDLAVIAAQRALDAAGLSADQIDLIIVATSTPDMIFPSTATLVQHKLAIKNQSPAFDVQAVCCGFVYGLSIAEKFIHSGSCRHVLVIGAETFSRIIDWDDRSTCVLFGDGAGAVILSASDTPGILGSALHADGAYHEQLCVPGHVRNAQVYGDPLLRMNGQSVFKFAVHALTQVSLEVLNQCQIQVEQLDWIIPHQANIRIMQSTAKHMGLGMDKIVSTVSQHGNTSAASIPLALDTAVREGKIQAGNKVLLQGIGGGFAWGASLIQF